MDGVVYTKPALGSMEYISPLSQLAHGKYSWKYIDVEDLVDGNPLAECHCTLHLDGSWIQRALCPHAVLSASAKTNIPNIRIFVC